MADDSDKKIGDMAGEELDDEILMAGIERFRQVGFKEEKESAKAIVIRQYPRLRQLMKEMGLSVRQLYLGLKANGTPLKMSERTFATYMQIAKSKHEQAQAQETAKPKRGRPSKKHEGAEGALPLSKPKNAQRVLPVDEAAAAEGASPESAELVKAVEGAVAPEQAQAAPDRLTVEEVKVAVDAAPVEESQEPAPAAGLGHVEGSAPDKADPLKAESAEARYERHAAELDDKLAELAAQRQKGGNIN